MRTFGLIGRSLKHSFSPNYFKEKFEREGLFDVRYLAFELDHPESVLKIFEEGVQGLNVTVPYKEAVIPYLDELDAVSNSVMAVNTIMNNDGYLVGYNTDVYGFERSIEDKIDILKSGPALILGSGGASKAVRFVLDRHGINYNVISRNSGDLRYKELDFQIIDEHKFIINTTPLGMYPDEQEYPEIPYAALGEKHLVYDLIYNPEKTLFLTKAEEQGAQIQNGYNMLIFQAERSWEIWNKKI